MIHLILAFFFGGISSIWAYRYFTQSPSKYDALEEGRAEGVIYMLDKDIDTKFTLGDLVRPAYNAFEKPHKTCRMIKTTPPDVQIKLVLSTKGGSLAACDKIVKTLKKHPAGYVAYISGECYSAGTMVALGAEDIVMNHHSYLGKIDPQESSITSSTSLVNYHDLPAEHVDSSNAHRVLEARNVINYTFAILDTLFKGHANISCLPTIKEAFIFSHMPHLKLFDYEECVSLGLHVRLPEGSESQYTNAIDDF